MVSLATVNDQRTENDQDKDAESPVKHYVVPQFMQLSSASTKLHTRSRFILQQLLPSTFAQQQVTGALPAILETLQILRRSILQLALVTFGGVLHQCRRFLVVKTPAHFNGTSSVTKVALPSRPM